jgi:hypothetical protein
MSTKIYNVWLTNEGFGKVMTSLLRLKVKAEDAYRTELRTFLGLGAGSNKEVIFNGAMFAAENIVKGYAVLNPTCSAVTYAYPYPGADGKKNSLLVQLFGVDRSLHKAFTKSIRGADFHYQDQTDEPEDVPAVEWKARRQVWDKVLPGVGNPSENGMAFDLITNRRSLELVFAELALALPPENKPTQDGRPWEEWGPRCYGMYRGQDAEWAWRRGKEAWAKFEEDVMNERLKPFTPEDQSLNSAML